MTQERPGRATPSHLAWNSACLGIDAAENLFSVVWTLIIVGKDCLNQFDQRAVAI